MESGNSDSKHAVVHAKNNRSCLVPIDEVWDTYRLVGHVIKSLFCMHKKTDEGWNPYRLVMLVQITLFTMHKTTGEVWDP